MEIEANKTKLDWNKIIDNQENSGLSQAEYCKQNGLDLAKLAYYRGRIKTKQRLIDPNSTEFKPVKITSQESQGNEIKLSLPNGFQCSFSSRIDAAQLKKLIEILLSC